MKKRKIVPALIIAMSLGIFGYSCSKPVTIKKIKPQGGIVFNQKTKTFIKREGGIHEELLNSIKDPSLKKYCTNEEAIETYKMIDYHERASTFKPLPWIYWPSKLQTQTTLAENSTIISELKSNTKGEGYEKLKNLLLKTDEIYENAKNDLEKIIKIYSFLSEHLKSTKDTLFSSVGIIELLENGEGDCNDLSATYCAIFRSYGINCDIKYGYAKYSDGAEGGHAWLRIDSNNYTFDLDPMRYKKFIPLEPRI